MMGTEHECHNWHSTVEHLIVQQLQAASPASLPIDFITRGILCSGIEFSHNTISCALQNLCESHIIIKITEGGLRDRYRLVTPYIVENQQEDE